MLLPALWNHSGIFAKPAESLKLTFSREIFLVAIEQLNQCMFCTCVGVFRIVSQVSQTSCFLKKKLPFCISWTLPHNFFSLLFDTHYCPLSTCLLRHEKIWQNMPVAGCWRKIVFRVGAVYWKEQILISVNKSFFIFSYEIGDNISVLWPQLFYTFFCGTWTFWKVFSFNATRVFECLQHLSCNQHNFNTVKAGNFVTFFVLFNFFLKNSFR